MGYKMVINANIDKEISPYLEVLDLVSGEFIREVEQVDLSTGEYWTYCYNQDSSLQRDNIEGLIFQRNIGNIVLVYKGE